VPRPTQARAFPPVGSRLIVAVTSTASCTTLHGPAVVDPDHGFRGAGLHPPRLSELALHLLPGKSRARSSPRCPGALRPIRERPALRDRSGSGDFSVGAEGADRSATASSRGRCADHHRVDAPACCSTSRGGRRPHLAPRRRRGPPAPHRHDDERQALRGDAAAGRDRVELRYRHERSSPKCTVSMPERVPGDVLRVVVDEHRRVGRHADPFAGEEVTMGQACASRRRSSPRRSRTARRPGTSPASGRPTPSRCW
jgi:hypothetical protein